MSLSFKHFLWAPLALVAVLALFSELAGGQHVPTDEELEESYNQEMHEWEATLSPKCAAEGITPIKAFDIMERCEAQKALDEYIQLQLANDKKLQKKCGSTINDIWPSWFERAIKVVSAKFPETNLCLQETQDRIQKALEAEFMTEAMMNAFKLKKCWEMVKGYAIDVYLQIKDRCFELVKNEL